MLFARSPRSILSEAASADLLNPEVSDEVKDVVDDLEDILTNNIEEVKDGDKTTNGGIPVTTESVSIMESGYGYGDARYLVRLEDVMAIKEAEGEEAAAEMKEPGEAPTPEEVDAAAPDAGNVIEDIANKNGVEPEQVAVVITAESLRLAAQNAIMESKCGYGNDNALGLARKVQCIKELKNKGVKVMKA